MLLGIIRGKVVSVHHLQTVTASNKLITGLRFTPFPHFSLIPFNRDILFFYLGRYLPT